MAGCARKHCEHKNQTSDLTSKAHAIAIIIPFTFLAGRLREYNHDSLSLTQISFLPVKIFDARLGLLSFADSIRTPSAIYQPESGVLRKHGVAI